MPNRISDKPPVPYSELRIRTRPANKPHGGLFEGGIGSISDPRMCMAIIAGRPGELLFNELKIRLREGYEDLRIEAPDLTPLDTAFDKASIAHAGQVREVGKIPYIFHVLDIIEMMIEDRWFEIPSIAASILHDSPEETVEKAGTDRITIGTIKEALGAEVAMLVNGLTKLRKLGSVNMSGEKVAVESKESRWSKEQRERKNFEKWFSFIARDIRVAMLKLKDRVANSRTFDQLPEEKGRRNAQETLDTYVVIAHGLGMWLVRNELEANSYRVLFRDEFKKVEELLAKEEMRTESMIKETTARVLAALKERFPKGQVAVEHQLEPAAELFRKYQKDPKLSFEDASHNFVVEVEEPNCYEVIRLLHGRYRYKRGSFQDYISDPLKNKFSALLTTVFVPGVGDVTFKVMSKEMRRRAEYGPLAAYSPSKPDWYKDPAAQYQCIQEIMAEILKRKGWKGNDIRGIARSYIYTIPVFTAQGEQLDIPADSTALDFAYHIHTDIGRTAKFARIHRGQRLIIDEEMSAPLERSDRVEIVTDPKLRPMVEDLKRVSTPRARGKIMAYLKTLPRKDVEKTGLEYFEKALEAHQAAPEDLSPHRSYLKSEDLKTKTRIHNQEVFLFREYMERLNSVLPEGWHIQRIEDIYYYIGLGLLDYTDVVEILLHCLQERQAKAKHTRVLKVQFRIRNRPGILAAITPELADLNLNIIKSDSNVKGRTANPELHIRISGGIYGDINRIQVINILKKLKGVSKITDEYL